MATNTYTAIATQTLASAASSVTFSSIPQGYTDLQIVISATASGLVNGRLQVNGDTSSGLYSTTVLYGTGSSAASTRQSGQNSIWLDNTDTGSNTNVTTISLMSYSNATTYKTCLVRGSAASTQVDAHVGLWRNTNAITSITLFPSSGTYSAGSTFNLYGVAAASVGAKATGGTIYSDSSYYYHVFAASGTFTPTQALSCDVLAVAGGGGGGSRAGGGGGAGGLLYSTSQSMTTTAYTITVGAGGAGGTSSGGQSGSQGVNSTISGSGFTTLTATGGGYGGGESNAGGNGGSGGGGGQNTTSGAGTGSQGSNGGNGSSGTGTGAGGGGYAVVGANTGTGTGGAGTNTYSALLSVVGFGSSGYIAGGGGAGSFAGVQTVGGVGGGANGGKDAAAGSNGVANTGGGAGGGGAAAGTGYSGGTGGSGVVIVRYAK